MAGERVSMSTDKFAIITGASTGIGFEIASVSSMAGISMLAV